MCGCDAASVWISSQSVVACLESIVTFSNRYLQLNSIHLRFTILALGTPRKATARKHLPQDSPNHTTRWLPEAQQAPEVGTTALRNSSWCYWVCGSLPQHCLAHLTFIYRRICRRKGASIYAGAGLPANIWIEFARTPVRQGQLHFSQQISENY